MGAHASRRRTTPGFLRRRSAPRLIALATVVTLAGAPRARLAAQQPAPAVTQQAARRNPQQLRATQTLARREPGAPAQVRFEWNQVAGAHAYLLAGRWTSPPSWAVHTRRYRVTPGNAAAWTPRRVAFDAAIPEGNHSWSVVALLPSTTQRGGEIVADSANPTTLSFDVR